MKTALITGINGQDGSYLCEHLLQEGYKVYGILKRNSVTENQTFRINSIFDEIADNLEYADLTDMPSLLRLISTIKPDHLYNLGAQSHVQISFNQPVYTSKTISEGTINLLECIKSSSPKTKFYQASSSEMFGNSIEKDGFQRESTPMIPVSPYGSAKLFAYNIVRIYRKSYKIFASNGILFNHESPRRGINFVTNKIAREAVMIKNGLSDKLVLGNLQAKRDWGHAKDYVRAMEMILNHKEPDDFVCATGQTHSVQDFCDYVFKKLNIPMNKIETSSKYLRPYELEELKGDFSKLKNATGWKPEYTFHEMIDEMIEHWEKNISK
tara:strand:- start:1259 stop:2233 length:975 start_codon:yes stop_codon:yes gene_type:complete